MKVGSFELKEPLPELRQPHVIASLRPWVDAGSVGSLGLARLERHLGGQDLGSLSTPGTFFDFTRYRPVMHYQDGNRRLTIPNTIVRWAAGQGDCDFVFLHMLEPHTFAEEYIDSVIALLKQLNVKRYCRIGGMYDAVPHTRPLLVMGSLDGEEIKDVSGVSRSRRSPYQGPTSIMNLVTEKLSDLDIENMTLMVRLPQYVQLEEDFTGAARLLNVLCSMYNFPAELSVSRRGIRQYERISAEINSNSGVKALVEKLETDYDNRVMPPPDEEPPPLAPSVEKFLRDLGNQLGDSQT
ncbi:MAG: PAC2 family protein [Dehalococcoidia bacterium]